MTNEERKVIELALEASKDLCTEFALAKVQEILTKALAQPEQEPLTGGDERRHIICLCPDCTSPPQRTWVGLTDDERDEICLGDESIARSIEAELKKKNSA